MSGSPGLSHTDNFVYISDDLQPKSREDGSYRLAYLTATISMLSADCIADCLSQCRQGKYGEAIRALAAEPIAYDKYADAIKHLSCIILYLLSFEQGEKCPDWLADFLASSVRAMDQVVEGTAVKTIMERYAMVSGDDVYDFASRSLLEDLNFASRADIASQPLAEYLRNSGGFRSQILYFALSQDRDYIEKRWREIIAQNTLSLD
ncbi:MAG: hypothetical protein K2X27_14040 [Candidatus Obscuribacterales bacterium]|nr:hypothetical protein [Candidatus Obscuribacterales bacterium]